MLRRDDGWFYRSPTHDEALARLHYLVTERQRLGIMLGPAGSGKSATLEKFASELAGSRCETVSMSPAGLSARDVMFQLAQDLGTRPDAEEPEFSWWRRIEDRLTSHRYQQLATVVLCDDADRASAEVTSLLLRLMRLGRVRGAQVTLVLSAQRERLARLDPYLMDLCDLRIELVPWEETDLGGFLQWTQLHQAHSVPGFTPAAVTRLRQLSRGVPRQVHKLVSLATVAARGQQIPHIDVRTLETVFTELHVATENMGE